jgi:pimeloyl-ACP methyl ester carboxylesterase
VTPSGIVVDMRDAETLELHAGPLRFTAYAQGHGPLVICLHGFPDHARSFRHQLPVLAAAGYRAVAPVLRGYEPSSQPRDGHYFIADLVDDLLAWIDELGEQEARVIGHDWGAIIAYAAAARAPERLRCMVTMAVPHMRRFLPAMRMVMPAQLRRSWYVLFFQLRRASNFVMDRDFGVIDKLWRDWSPGWRPEADEYEAIKATFAQPGVRRAAMGYYRGVFGSTSPRSRESWKLMTRKTPVPTLAMTGAIDGCVDTRLHDFGDWEADYLAPSRVLRIEQAGHFLHQERPDVVNEAILDWLRAHEH